jgi:hypothetical protein
MRQYFSPAHKCIVVGSGDFVCMTGAVDSRKTPRIFPNAVYEFATAEERTDWLTSRKREDPAFHVTILGPWQTTEKAVLPRVAEER